MAAGVTKPSGMPGWPSWDAWSALAAMDRLDIAAALLSISAPGVHFGDDAAARDLARAVNEAGAQAVAAHPSRFGLFASLPLPDVDASLREITHVTHLLLSGTLARRPKIRFIVPHAGAALPTLSDRIAGTIPALRVANLPSPDQIVALLRGLHYDLAGFVVPKMLPSLLAVAPRQQLLYGSDWPFTSEAAVRRLALQLDSTLLLAAGDNTLIARANALGLFPRLAT